MKTTLTHSMINAFKTCRKMYDFRYIKGIAPNTESAPLFFGSIVHEGLEVWLKTQSQDAAKAAVLAHLEGASEKDSYDVMKALALVLSYIKTYDHDVQYDEIEFEFSAPILNPKTRRKSKAFLLRGKIDGFVTTESGRVYIVEHKTATAPDNGLIEKIKAQSLLYAVGMHYRALQWDKKAPFGVDGVMCDIIIKPMIRPKKEETKDEFFDRCLNCITQDNFKREYIEFTTEMIEAAKNELWQVSKDMLKPSIYGNCQNCSQFSKDCPFLQLCLHNGCVEDCLGLYDHKAPHTELSKEVDQ